MMFDSLITKEAYLKVFLAFIAFIFFVIIGCGLLALLSFVITILLIYVYRYKHIDVTTLEKEIIYAPISGIVTSIDSKDFTKTVFIKVGLFDNHILRNLEDNPIDIEIQRGLNFSLNSLKSKRLNEKATINYKNTTMKLHSSFFNPSISILNRVKSKKGEKISMFIDGVVAITINSSVKIDVKIGQKIESGVTKLAQLENKA